MEYRILVDDEVALCLRRDFPHKVSYFEWKMILGCIIKKFISIFMPEKIFCGPEIRAFLSTLPGITGYPAEILTFNDTTICFSDRLGDYDIQFLSEDLKK